MRRTLALPLVLSLSLGLLSGCGPDRAACGARRRPPKGTRPSKPRLSAPKNGLNIPMAGAKSSARGWKRGVFKKKHRSFTKKT